MSSSSAPATGTWTHLVGVHDANAKTIKLNGANAGFFPGKIGDAQAWNYALTAKQVSALYQQVN